VDAAFIEPFALVELDVSVTASVGMAFAGPGEEISDLLVVEADTAMYQAKRKGGAAHQIIDLREASLAADRVSLETDLRLALARGELAVAYQPIVRSTDGLITGVEALLRWTHPVRGSIPPVWAIGIAEQSGLITELGQWVLTQACTDHAAWPRLHRGAPLDLAVNVSARQLMSAGFCGTVADVLARTGMDPTALVLEMTEYILIEDSDRAMTVLSDLKTLGIRIALDDFGTGYSSLSYLESLPIDILKVDQGFIAKIGAAPTGREIVAAVTNLAHVLGMTVTAEGVETQRQRDVVATIGCESAQGFFYAKPMSAAQIGTQLAVSPNIPVHLPDGRRPVVLT
jgi:EAL domain-containing protein (putative c-di-GMP-specific phosphodiesterase class I)